MLHNTLRQKQAKADVQERREQHQGARVLQGKMRQKQAKAAVQEKREQKQGATVLQNKMRQKQAKKAVQELRKQHQGAVVLQYVTRQRQARQRKANGAVYMRRLLYARAARTAVTQWRRVAAAEAAAEAAAKAASTPLRAALAKAEATSASERDRAESERKRADELQAELSAHAPTRRLCARARPRGAIPTETTSAHAIQPVNRTLNYDESPKPEPEPEPESEPEPEPPEPEPEPEPKPSPEPDNEEEHKDETVAASASPEQRGMPAALHNVSPWEERSAPFEERISPLEERVSPLEERMAAQEGGIAELRSQFSTLSSDRNRVEALEAQLSALRAASASGHGPAHGIVPTETASAREQRRLLEEVRDQQERQMQAMAETKSEVTEMSDRHGRIRTRKPVRRSGAVEHQRGLREEEASRRDSCNACGFRFAADST